MPKKVAKSFLRSKSSSKVLTVTIILGFLTWTSDTDPPVPYLGGSGHTMFASFSGAMFVTGGSGITFALGAVQDLVHKDLRGESRLKIIELVWIVQDPCVSLSLILYFSHMTNQLYSSNANAPHLNVYRNSFSTHLRNRPHLRPLHSSRQRPSRHESLLPSSPPQ